MVTALRNGANIISNLTTKPRTHGGTFTRPNRLLYPIIERAREHLRAIFIRARITKDRSFARMLIEAHDDGRGDYRVAPNDSRSIDRSRRRLPRRNRSQIGVGYGARLHNTIAAS